MEEPRGEPPRASDTDTVADLDSEAGDGSPLSTIGRYVVLDSVGMGGMGLVCAAYDPKLNRKVALKLLRNASTDEASTAGRSRLFREAQALAQLSHPNVVTVHDVDVFEGRVYIAMEFVEGTSMREWLGEPHEWHEILAKFVLAGRGLVAAHSADIIHRDFKPANVLISHEGEIRVADFGVAKERDRDVPSEHELGEYDRWRRTSAVAEGTPDSTAEDALIEEIQSNVSRNLTVAGRMVGTPAYMAPEQHMGLQIGPYTDQYAFCVSLYEALYGRAPYEGVDRRDQLAKMTEGKLPPPPKEGKGKGVPKRIYKILARGLRPHHTERWPSMIALLAALERDPLKRVRRSAVIGVGVVGLAAGVFGVIYGLGDDEPVDHCAQLSEDIGDHWSSDRQVEVERALLSSGQPYADDTARRVTATLDRWASSWSTQRVAICEATRLGRQSEPLLDLRMSCLDERAAAFDATVSLLVEADADVVERSVKLAYSIAEPHDCASATADGGGEPLDPGSLAAEELAELNADINRAFALASVEKFDESLPLQARVVTRARELEHPRALVRALHDLSQSQFETGDVEGGEQSLREAITLAAALGDHAQEARSWSRMIFYLGSKHHRFVEAHAWSLAASSALIRAQRPASSAIHHEGTLAALDFAEGDVEAAVEHYALALALARETRGENHPTTITMMMNYGAALARAERYDDAERVLREAVSRSKEVYGPTHPGLAKVYYNLGQVYLVSGQLDEAEEPFRQSLEIRERIDGPSGASLAGPLYSLAKLAKQGERYEDALIVFERVLALFVEAKGERSREVAAVRTVFALTLQALGRYEAAKASFDQVAAIYAEIYPDGHLFVAGLDKRRCRLLIAASEWTAAVEACERALDLDDRLGAEDKVKLEVYELLAEAERGRGRLLAADRAQGHADALTHAIAASDD